MALLVCILSLLCVLIPNESVQGTVCLTSIFLLEWLFWYDFFTLLSRFDTQCNSAGNRLSHVDIPLRMALLVRVLSLLSSFDTNESAGNRPSHVDIPLRMALLVMSFVPFVVF
ncbi:hypothetical protein TNCT_113861 [Trichonephila clavata]|uniref:Secreted peptide n=1 Tax=Trichonephila clavata TaxID=2740835 RepID=A0A8X6KK80_TRICU|nr:hypothetical protein TNCT_113861 [Trichonephila clavata]